MTGPAPEGSALTTVLAFDYGRRRIGVAVGNLIINTATPLTTLANTDQGPDWPALEKLCAEWCPDLLIIGLPVMLDGSPSANYPEVENFAQAMDERFSMPIVLVDEKLSSVEAKEQIKAARQSGLRRRTRSGDVDKFAAQVILRSWLNQRDQSPPDLA